MSNFKHGDNIECKLRNEKDPQNKSLLKEIKDRYLKWKESNLLIKGSSRAHIEEKVRLLNEYKFFIEQSRFKKTRGNKSGFTSQSQLHSSVIEEFMYYLFKDIKRLSNKKVRWGRVEAYTNLYFDPPNIDEFEKRPNIIINVKDQDFCISKEVIIKSRLSNNQDWQEKLIFVPFVAIECKTYLDKTMYEGSVSTAEKIKRGNPHCLFLIVTEMYNVSLTVDPSYSQIDQIYVLRKDRRANPIDYKVVYDLFKFVESHINSDWYNIQQRLKSGKMV